MKILQVLVLIFGLAVIGNSQDVEKFFVLTGNVYDANKSVVVSTKITAKNENGKEFKAISNDEGVYKLSLPFGKYTIEFQQDGFKLLTVINFENFSVTEKTFDANLEVGRCEDCNGAIYGERIDEKDKTKEIDLSKLNSEKRTAVLSGTVYDQKGEVISQAKIIVQNRDGKKFVTLTNADGEYKIDLPYTMYKTPEDVRTQVITRYTIQAVFTGFRVTEIKDFIFTKPKFGSMQLDITLEVGLIGDGNFNKNKKRK